VKVIDGFTSRNPQLLEWLGAAPPKFVYTSSTSVYGQNDGSTVEEPAGPSLSPRLPGLVEPKQLVTAAQERHPAVVIRVAGIYGPGRILVQAF
jgi:nucleoside-diphosphate-sugar epimerase